MKGIKIEIDRSVRRKSIISNNTKERDGLNVLMNNEQNKSCFDWRRRKTDGPSIVDEFQLNGHKGDG